MNWKLVAISSIISGIIMIAISKMNTYDVETKAELDLLKRELDTMILLASIRSVMYVYSIRDYLSTLQKVFNQSLNANYADNYMTNMISSDVLRVFFDYVNTASEKLNEMIEYYDKVSSESDSIFYSNRYLSDTIDLDDVTIDPSQFRLIEDYPTSDLVNLIDDLHVTTYYLVDIFTHSKSIGDNTYLVSISYDYENSEESYPILTEIKSIMEDEFKNLNMKVLLVRDDN